MKTLTSKDGTRIAYDQVGEGPALLLVTGAFATRADAASLAANLSPYFTVFSYDRRGRGSDPDPSHQLDDYPDRDLRSAEPEVPPRRVHRLRDSSVGSEGNRVGAFHHNSGSLMRCLDASERGLHALPMLGQA